MSEAGCKRGPWSPPGEASGCGPLEWSILRREEGRSGRGGPLPTPALCLRLRPVGVCRSSVHFPLAVKSTDTHGEWRGSHLGSTEKPQGVCNPQRCPQNVTGLACPWERARVLGAWENPRVYKCGRRPTGGPGSKDGVTLSGLCFTVRRGLLWPQLPQL